MGAQRLFQLGQGRGAHKTRPEAGVGWGCGEEGPEGSEVGTPMLPRSHTAGQTPGHHHTPAPGPSQGKPRPCTVAAPGDRRVRMERGRRERVFQFTAGDTEHTWALAPGLGAVGTVAGISWDAVRAVRVSENPLLLPETRAGDTPSSSHTGVWGGGTGAAARAGADAQDPTAREQARTSFRTPASLSRFSARSWIFFWYSCTSSWQDGRPSTESR